MTVAGALIALGVSGPALAAGAPRNDDIADAITLRGDEDSVRGTTEDATREALNYKDGPHSVWYLWRPRNGGGDVQLGTCRGDGPKVTASAFYVDSDGDPKEVADLGPNPIHYSKSEVRCIEMFEARAGERYAIRLTSRDPGPFRLALKRFPRPANDDFSDAEPVRAAGQRIEGTTISASEENSDPKAATGTGDTVWYTFRPKAATHYALLETRNGERISTRVFTVHDSAGLVEVDIAGDDREFIAEAGRRYFIWVDTYNAFSHDSGELPSRFQLRLVVVPPPEHPGSISGIVTDDAGAGIAGICIELSRVDQPDPERRSAPTDAAGAYEIGGLPPGKYIVYFTKCSGRYRYTPEYYDDARRLKKATPVRVGPDRAVSGIDAELAPIPDA